ncbi:hypothetical protein [Prescottella equi]|uniref:hypothetical protein n=1 Tax=Rhodococcus hoagii TaxID=43767 RepID=UPI0011AAC2CE|nr:hypothetical protein [Prescottella equi]
MIAEAIGQIGAILDAHGGIDAYLFGSALTRDDPADIDLLIVYPDRHQLHRFLAELERIVGPLAIDLTAMTACELAGSGFLDRSKAVPIREFRGR